MRAANPENPTNRVFITGGAGFIGTALCEKLQTEGYENLLLKRSSEVDLRQQSAVNEI